MLVTLVESYTVLLNSCMVEDENNDDEIGLPTSVLIAVRLNLLQVAIPVVPTVRVVVTFTKFIDLQPAEQFFTPMSSPRQLQEEHSCAASTRLQSVSHQGLDPFAIPSDYTWTSIDAKNKKMKKSKSKKEK